MARGSQSTAYQGSLYYAKVSGLKEGEKVHFELTSKNPDGSKKVDGQENKLTGLLVSAKHRQDTYQGQVYDKIVLILNDPQAGKNGESYYISVNSSTGIGRNIMNSLLSTDTFVAPLSISLYNSKEGGYPNVGMYLGGERLPWKYSIEEQSKYISTTKEKVKDASGKVVTKDKKNYLELNEFLLNQFKEKVIPAVNSTPRTSHSYETSSASEGTQMASSDDKMPWED